jgi:hypothetical protein
MRTDVRRPEASEYAPYYADYIAKAPEGEVRAALRAQRDELARLFAEVPRARADHRYAEGKWTVRELVGHILDAEWVFTCRALHFARGNPGPLPSMDQDDFLAHGNYGARSLDSLAQEFSDLRAASLAQFDSLTPEALDRRGTASERVISVRALLYVIAGHAQHHATVLRERYL